MGFFTFVQAKALMLLLNCENMKTLNPLAIELYTIFYQYPDRKVVYRYNNTLEEANDILSRLTDHQKELQIPGTNPSYYDNPLPN